MQTKNWLRPVPKVIISYSGRDEQWFVETTTYITDCSYDPPLIMIGLDRSQDGREIVKQKKEFAVNLVTEKLVEPYEQIKESGSLKLEESSLQAKSAEKIKAPLIKRAPVNFECQVINSLLTGSHQMFVSRIKTIHADEQLVTKAGRIDFSQISFLT